MKKFLSLGGLLLIMLVIWGQFNRNTNKAPVTPPEELEEMPRPRPVRSEPVENAHPRNLMASRSTPVAEQSHLALPEQDVFPAQARLSGVTVSLTPPKAAHSSTN